MTPERLEAVREHLETTGYSHAFKPQAFELLEEVDRLTAEVARLRAGIGHARWAAEVNESNDTRTLHALLDDLADLLNPPTEGELK